MGQTASLISIPWSKSIWFFDVDDTLIDTSDISAEATIGIEEVFTKQFSPKIGKKVRNEVNRLYNLMVDGYRVVNNDWSGVVGGQDAFEKTLSKIAFYQQRIIAQYGVPKKWSREIFVTIAAKQHNLEVSPQLVSQAAESYWQNLSKIVNPYQDAVKLFQAIKTHNRPIFLMTSSDARLQMAIDGQFDYSPSFSEKLKRQRLEVLKKKGFVFDALSIGDPEDKPHKDFFDKGIATAEKYLGHKINTQNAIMIGDSFTGDLQTPKDQMGFGLVVLYQKGKEEIEVIDEHYVVTGALGKLEQFFH